VDAEVVGKSVLIIASTRGAQDIKNCTWLVFFKALGLTPPLPPKKDMSD